MAAPGVTGTRDRAAAPMGTVRFTSGGVSTRAGSAGDMRTSGREVYPNRNPRPRAGPAGRGGRGATFPGPRRGPDSGVGKPDGSRRGRAGGRNPLSLPGGPRPRRGAMTLAEYLD